MRSATSWREICAGVFFIGSIALAAESASATPKVVGDEACDRHAVDIASFATCVDGRAVVPEDDAPPRLLVVADEACEHYAVDIASFATCIDGHVARPDDVLGDAEAHLAAR